MTRPTIIALGIIGLAFDALTLARRLQSLPAWLHGVLVARAVDAAGDPGADPTGPEPIEPSAPDAGDLSPDEDVRLRWAAVTMGEGGSA